MNDINKILSEYEEHVEKEKIKKILACDFNEIGWDKKRLYLIHESNNTCQNCGLHEWLGQKIPIEIDHIDGDHSNNDKSNLKVLCANCHSLTKNWRDRNKTSKRLKIPNSEILKSLIENNWNIRQTLISFKLSPKGGNYKRCHKIKKEYENFGSINDNKILNDIDHEKFMELYNSSKPYREIASLLGISYSRLKKYVITHKIKVRERVIDIEEILSLYMEFKSIVKVGKFYGVSDNAVRKWLIKFGINPKEIKKIVLPKGDKVVCATTAG